MALAFVWASILLIPTFAPAQDWRVQVGAQSRDKALQVIAFLPNEIWIHAGDSIAFKVATDEPHTVTFLMPNQVFLPFSVGCPGTTPSGGPVDGSSCVNSGPLSKGQSYSMTFPEPGNYKLVCLYHQNHTAVIHVLDLSAQLPHEQAFYSAEAADMQRNLLSSADNMMDHDMGSSPGVTAGTGAIVATGGGSDTLSIMRFMHPDKIVHVRETVEWTNDDPITPHTITFGVEPADPMPPSTNVTMDPDGALHATVSSPKDNVHSGFIAAAPQNQFGLPQPPVSITRFRVTFTRPGIFEYKCALHDNLGMVGRVIVLP
ncbi:MAG: plastocyanin/azurin family copper-binding protein [Acidobacteriaceae bacterium]